MTSHPTTAQHRENLELAQELAALLDLIDHLAPADDGDLDDALTEARAMATELCNELANTAADSSAEPPIPRPEDMPDSNIFDFIAAYGDGEKNQEAIERYHAWKGA